MNREILFRGRRIDNGEWVEGSLVNNVFFKAATKDPILYIVDTNAVDAELGYPYSDWDDVFCMVDYYLRVDPSTVGQYTGLKDKNGVRIFEGMNIAVHIKGETRPMMCFVQYIEDQYMVCIYEGAEWRDVGGLYNAVQYASVEVIQASSETGALSGNSGQLKGGGDE